MEESNNGSATAQSISSEHVVPLTTPPSPPQLYSSEMNQQQIESDNELTIDEALDKMIGFGPFQICFMLIAGFGWLFDGLELSLIGFVIPYISKDWNLSSWETGSLGAVVFLGMACSAYFGGYLSDKFGRKIVFILTMALTCIFGLASSFSFHFIIFGILRFIVGLGLGATVPVDFAFFMEWIPTKRRGAQLGIMNVFYLTGNIVCCIMAWVILVILEWNWQILIALASLPGFFNLLARFFVPESARFLVVQGRSKEALQILRRIYLFNHNPLWRFLLLSERQNKPKKLFDSETVLVAHTHTSSTPKHSPKREEKEIIVVDEPKSPPSPSSEGEEETISMSGGNVGEQSSLLPSSHSSKHATPNYSFFQQIKIILSPQLARTSILLWIIWTLLSFGSWGFTFLIPLVFDKLKHSDTQASPHTEYIQTLLVYFVALLGHILAALAMDKVKRRVLLSVTFVLSGISTIFISFWSHPMSVLIFSMVTNFITSFPWTCLYAYTPEVYPTVVRTTAMGICMAFTRIAGTVTPIFGNSMLSINIVIPYVTFGVSMILAGICSALLPIETFGRALTDELEENKKQPSFAH